MTSPGTTHKATSTRNFDFTMLPVAIKLRESTMKATVFCALFVVLSAVPIRSIKCRTESDEIGLHQTNDRLRS
uniref:Col_cuticle_N domain-containing protein n=1 Tax=Steinernema glaseri TaxID=37863 RepID=A0A1I7ZPS0_9BILA